MKVSLGEKLEISLDNKKYEYIVVGIDKNHLIMQSVVLSNKVNKIHIKR